MAALSDDRSEEDRLAEAMKAGVAASYYNSAKVDRDPFLQRARAMAALTIPYLFREEGANGSDQLIIPYNTIGAYCVSNLGSKVVFALFPPGRPNFKAEQDKATSLDLLQLSPQEQATIKGIIRQGLSMLEQDTAAAIEEDGDRARMFIAALHLIVGGNHAFQFYDDSTIRGIPFSRYVTTRDAQGNLLRFAIEDLMDWETVPEDVRKGITDAGLPPPSISTKGRTPVRVYTHGILLGGKWKLHQEVMGQVIKGSEATYARDRLPYEFLVWNRLDEEDYGRSYAELYEGDFLTVEGLTKSITDGAAAMARYFVLVAPAGMTDKRTIARARNGDVVSGREQDVSIPTAQGKSVDFQIASSQQEAAIQRLGKAFLLFTAVQRQGERVTAEEIRNATQELEDGLGGVYSQQVITWQKPYIQTKVRLLQKNGRVTPVPERAVKITVTAGLAALARNAELSSLRTFSGILSEAFGPQSLAQFLKPEEYSSRVAAALGIDAVGLIPTPEEIAEKAQQEQQAMMMQQLAPEALKQAGNYATSTNVAETNAAAKLATSSPAQAANPPAA